MPALLEEFQAAGSKAIPSTMPAMEQQAASQQFFAQQGEYFANKANLIAEYAAAQVPGATGQHLQQMKQFAEFVGQRAEAAKASQASNETETNN